MMNGVEPDGHENSHEIAVGPALAPGAPNGSLVGLWWISGLLGTIGVVLLIAGGVQNAGVNLSSVALPAANPTPGLPQLMWGGAFLGVAIPASMAALAVAVVRWIPPVISAEVSSAEV
jgi:hypothetical protein